MTLKLQRDECELQEPVNNHRFVLLFASQSIDSYKQKSRNVGDFIDPLAHFDVTNPCHKFFTHSPFPHQN